MNPNYNGNQAPTQGYPPQPDIASQYPPNNGGGGYYDPNAQEKNYPGGAPGYDFSQQQAPPPHNAMIYQNSSYGPGYNQQGPPQDQDRGAGAVAAGAGAGCCCACLAPILACCACCEILDCIF